MTPTSFEPVITVSATYGAGGSVVAPRLAETMGLAFIDRLISADAAGTAHHPRSKEGLVEGEQESSPVGRFLSYFARAATVGAVIGPEPDIQDDDDIRARTESELAPLRRGGGGVVLGRAAAVVLRERPRAYHIRLDGPPERRIEWAAAYENLGRNDAARRQAETDRTRASFVKRLYRVDPADPALYHLVVDSTAIGIDATVEVIHTAARAFFSSRDRHG